MGLVPSSLNQALVQGWVSVFFKVSFYVHRNQESEMNGDPGWGDPAYDLEWHAAFYDS
jgi:hypothetical protein